MSTIVEYPRNEMPWIRYCAAGETRYILTSKEDRSAYFLYEIADGKPVRLGKAKEPPELVEKYGVMDRLKAMSRL